MGPTIGRVCGLGAEVNVNHVSTLALDPYGTVVTEHKLGLDARALLPEEVLDRLVDLVRLTLADLAHRDIAPVALTVGVAGLVDRERDVLTHAPNLGWRDVPVGDLLRDKLDAAFPVAIDNEGNLAAIAEATPGDPSRQDILVIFGEVGVGGGIVADGRLLRGRQGYAGEFGHNRPRLDNPAHRATVGGTLEEEVSRARLLDILGMRTADEAQFDAAVLGSSNPALHAELARQQHVLAGALANAINVLGPQLVVLGGFLATLLSWDSEALDREVAARTLPTAWEGVRIRAAGLAQDRLLIGAAEIAFGEVLRDPIAFAQA